MPKPRKLGPRKTDRRLKTDAIRSLDDYKRRCVVDPSSKCWALALANETVSIWIGEENFVVSRRRAALMLAGRPIPEGHIPFQAANCYCAACVNPAHIQTGDRKALGAHLSSRGAFDTVTNRMSLQKAVLAAQKITAQDRQDIALSTERTSILCKRYDIDPAWVQRLRSRGDKPSPFISSVFTFRP